MAHKMSYLCNIFIFGRRSKYRFDQLFLKHPRFNLFDTKKGVEQSSCPLKPQFSMRKGSFLKKIAIFMVSANQYDHFRNKIGQI